MKSRAINIIFSILPVSGMLLILLASPSQLDASRGFSAPEWIFRFLLMILLYALTLASLLLLNQKYRVSRWAFLTGAVLSGLLNLTAIPAVFSWLGLNYYSSLINFIQNHVSGFVSAMFMTCTLLPVILFIQSFVNRGSVLK